MWTVELTPVAAGELAELPEDQRARFMRIRTLIQDHGLEHVRFTLTTSRGRYGRYD
jgi:hypothetical protein